jgi:hypothetical protein
MMPLLLQEGIGDYTIKGDTLELTFDEDTVSHKEGFHITKLPKSDPDSFKINLTVIGLEGFYYPQGNIIITYDDNLVSDTNSTYWEAIQCDSKDLSVPSNGKPHRLIAESIHCYAYSTLLSDEYDYSIVLYIDHDQLEYIRDTVLYYQIGEKYLSDSTKYTYISKGTDTFRVEHFKKDLHHLD